MSLRMNLAEIFDFVYLNQHSIEFNDLIRANNIKIPNADCLYVCDLILEELNKNHSNILLLSYSKFCLKDEDLKFFRELGIAVFLMRFNYKFEFKISTKVCTICFKEKLLDQFRLHNRKGYKFHDPYCKQCESQKSLEYKKTLAYKESSKKTQLKVVCELRNNYIVNNICQEIHEPSVRSSVKLNQSLLDSKRTILKIKRHLKSKR